MVSASSWSCVTYKNVIPTRSCSAFSSTLSDAAQLGVQRAERLVEQQHGRIEHQGPGQRDPLLLAAGQLPWPALLVCGHMHEFERLADLAPHGGLVDAPVAQAECDVLVRRRGTGTARSSGRPC